MKSYDNIPMYLIERKNPQTGFKETTTFLGYIRQKPKGWQIVEKLSGPRK